MTRSVSKILHQQERQLARQRREEARLARDREKNAKLARVRSRQEECDKKNQHLDEAIAELESLLAFSLAKTPPFTWPKWQRYIAQNGLPLPEPSRPELPPAMPLERPSFLAALLPWVRKKHEQDKAAAANALDRERERLDEEHAEKLNQIRTENRTRANRAAAQMADLHQTYAGYKAGDGEAIARVIDLTLAWSKMPTCFPCDYRCTFMAASRQAVVEFRAPSLADAIPSVERYRYVKSRDAIDQIPRSSSKQRELYTRLISQLALRLLSEIFRSDPEATTESVVVNVHVHTIDATTGREISPCLVSVRATRNEFMQLDLRRVDPIKCLKGLKAAVSQSPSELLAVRPILEFDMADPRFIEEEDILSKIDNRTNLMSLSPVGFENLITNLFQKMGLDTKPTQASRDGGVDCVAFDSRPVLGGKVIVQAKRYKNTVGVSAVRDLFGTVHNEGATKGILVTTSGYGAAAFEFANGKPLQLISGGELLYLLKEHAGLDAKIEMPDDWDAS